MMAAGQGRVPVTDAASGALVGLLTCKDLLQVRATVVRSERERRAFLGPRPLQHMKARSAGGTPDAR